MEQFLKWLDRSLLTVLSHFSNAAGITLGT